MTHQFQPLRFGLVGTVSLLLVLGTANFTPTQALEIPSSIKPCLPMQTRPPIERVEAIAHTQAHQKDYYLLSVYPASGQGIDLVISTQRGQCQQEFFNPAGEVSSLTQTLGQDVARQLALGRYRREIEVMGRTKLQQRINETVVSKGIFYPEDVWALRQLGFSIPQALHVTQ